MVFLLSTAGCESSVKSICHAKQHAETDRGCLHTKDSSSMLFYRADARHEIVCRESANYECAWLWQSALRSSRPSPRHAPSAAFQPLSGPLFSPASTSGSPVVLADAFPVGIFRPSASPCCLTAHGYHKHCPTPPARRDPRRTDRTQLPSRYGPNTPS